MRFKIDWASLVGSEFTVFVFFFSLFEGNFPSTSPRGAYIWRGYLTEGFLRYRFGGLILEGLVHGGAYFRNFTVACRFSSSTPRRKKTTISFCLQRKGFEISRVGLAQLSLSSAKTAVANN